MKNAHHAVTNQSPNTVRVRLEAEAAELEVKWQETFRFQLYVAGAAQNSAQAASNLDAFCREYLADCHEIEIVDVFGQPERALAEGIFMTPTLVKLAPIPAPLRIVGTLSEKRPLMDALGLDSWQV